MSRAGKAAEPSMEEILSLIRKIIAEEPVDSPAAVPQKAAVDDVLELADGAPRTEIANGAEASKASAAAVPSWLFSTAQGGTEADVGESSVKPKAAAEAAREVPKPFFSAAGPAPEPATPVVAEAARVGTNGAHPRVTADVGRAEDLGAVVPRRSPEPGAPTVTRVTERRSPQAGLPEWLSRASGAAKPVPAPQPIAAPTEPTRIAPRDAEAPGPALSELAKLLSVAAAPETVATVAAPAVAPDVAPVVVATAVVAPAPETPASEAPTAVVEKASRALVTTEAASHGAVPKPTLLGERSRSPKVNGASEMVPTVAQAGGIRTLDDTIIDLLRPMIRQWLDDNMPRMVEKALRVELAAGVKPKADQPKH